MIIIKVTYITDCTKHISTKNQKKDDGLAENGPPLFTLFDQKQISRVI